MYGYVTGVLPFGTFDTVLRFEVTAENEERYVIGVDHRPARDILEALEIEGEVEIYFDTWQILGAA